jgi:FkbM family methyltransferase
MPLADGFRTARGILRSLRIYHFGRDRRVAMNRFYSQFVKKDDLVFDIGAHVGDRVAAFRRLGARVIAAEPQPALARILRVLFWRDRLVTIEPQAVGRQEGMVTLKLNLDNPTISTASDAFVSASQGAPGWEGQDWVKSVQVPLTTLDALMARYGQPSFIKIDVEGLEADVLAGLSRPVVALSFEFTTIQRDVARLCVARCVTLGYRAFNASLGESLSLIDAKTCSAADILHWLEALPLEANSGDIYAFS